MEYTLLRDCFAFPNFAFALCTTDTSNHQDLLERFDRAVRAALEGILGSPLTDSQWLQASLPISKGGFGLRLARSHGSAAYLASLANSQSLVQEIRQGLETGDLQTAPTLNQLPTAAALEDLNSLLGDPLSIEEVISSSQQMLSALVDAESSRLLLEGTVEVREVARLRCGEGGGRGLAGCPPQQVPRPPPEEV